jgi:hypothetical protein
MARPPDNRLLSLARERIPLGTSRCFLESQTEEVRFALLEIARECASYRRHQSDAVRFFRSEGVNVTKEIFRNIVVKVREGAL